jgi:signal recognition particle subunit SRP19
METVVWPVYIDSNYSRGNGRKLALEYCVDDPKIREINFAAKKLKLDHKMEGGSSYPGSWWERSGRVIINRENVTKLELLKNISKMIKASRERK